jgi:hypothetical protein
MIYYDISVVYDSDSEYASRRVFLPVPSRGHLSIVRAICQDWVRSLLLTSLLLVRVSLCVKDLAEVYLCHE